MSYDGYPLFYLKETAVGKVVLTTFVALYEAASSSTMINKEIKMSHLMAGVTSIVWGTTLVSSKSYCITVLHRHK